MSLDDIAPGSRVVVAMSGGVDSSVTAALLKERGCEVIGMTLQLYDHGQAISSRPGSCCAGRDIHDARRVADRLDIPHYVLDYEAVFRRQVMDAFGESYLAGETPIPCVLCNQKVKFADLLDMARDLGADALATGHYVRRSEGQHGPILQRAFERERDQSYFLFTTTRDQLAFLRFPLGTLPKQETRELARHLDLPVSEKPDSQDICFIPTGRYRDFLERWRPETHQPGEIVDTDGRVLGLHSGIAGYTVGQRRGLGIAAPEPLYVIAVDPPSARVIVGPVTALQKDCFEIRSVNWLGDAPLGEEGVAVQVKVRSTMAAIDAHVKPLASERARVTLHQPFAAIAPGQACVFYQDDRLLGGGWIERDPLIGSKMGSSRQPVDTCPSTVS